MKNHAALLIKDADNKFLFIRRSKHKKTLPNIWSFPSGTQEENEHIHATAEREAMEELGIAIKAEHTLTTQDLPEFGVRLHFIVCRITAGEPSIKEPLEIAELDWLTFPDFFKRFSDDDIGHGLIHLRQNQQVWSKYL